MTMLFPELARSPRKGQRKGKGATARRQPPRQVVRDENEEERRCWPLQNTINVVLFAGMGGACEGMEEAGYPVHVALNHDEVAIAAHKARNPHTRHIRADICEVDPLEATRGRKVGQLWASPDCRDHSNAKGGAPRSPRVRSLPWQVCRWVGVLRKRGRGPDRVYLENVCEIRGWGPLIAKRDKATGRVLKMDGTVAAKGERVPRHQQQLVRNPKEVGRIYRAWVRHMLGLGAYWEDRDIRCADHGVPTTRKRLFGIATFDGSRPVWPEVTHAHRTSAAVREGRLLPHVPVARLIDWSLPLPSIFDREKPYVAATLKRIAVGFKRFVLQAEKPYLIHLTHQGVRPGIDPDDAAPTVTGAHRGELAIVGPALVPITHTKSPPRAHDGAEAVPTLTAGVKGGELAVTAAYVTKFHGERHPGEVRALGLEDPLSTQTTENRFGVIAAQMIQTGYGERHGQHPRCLDIEAPIGTQVAGGQKHAIVGAWLVQNNTGMVGHDPTDACPTLVSKEGPVAIGGAYLIHQRGTSTALSSEDACPTVTTGGDRGGDHVGIAAAYFQDREGNHYHNMVRARRVAQFLREQGVWDGGDVVTVGPYLVVDIGMRMFQPEEAAAAHELCLPTRIRIRKRDRRGNPVIDELGNELWIERPLTKTESMRLIGNSVPRRLPRLLLQLNAPLPLAMVAAE